MNLLIVFASLIIGLSAQAQSKVGDWATYKIKSITDSGDIRTGIETVKVLKINSETEQIFIEHIVVEETGPFRLVEKYWQDSADFVDAEVGQAYLDQCAQPEIGGTLETVKVPAGNLPTCKIGEPSGLTQEWYGPVSFGLIKSIYITQWVRDDEYIPVTISKELTAFGTK